MPSPPLHQTHGSLSRRERASLADLLEQAGPEQSTLCAGWNTGDLAAHLVMRERSPAAVGIAIPQFHGWTRHTQSRYQRRPFRHLVSMFRSGPHALSPLRVPLLDAAANTFEFVVHHEDVRRAQTMWAPRELSREDRAVLWNQLTTRARWYLRRSPVSVRLSSDGFPAIDIGNGDAGVVVNGDVVEILLMVHGRGQHTELEVKGEPRKVQLWRQYMSSL